MDMSVYDDKSGVDLKTGGLFVCKKCGKAFLSRTERLNHACSTFFDLNLIGGK